MDSLQQKEVFVIIPAYNEETHIFDVIAETKKYTDNIVVIDDGSIDKTFFMAKKAKSENANIVILRHEINLGKGAALKTGCEAAIRLGAKIMVTIDGDGQHDPADIPGLIEKLLAENLDIIFGSRQIDEKVPFVRALGNKILTKTMRFLSNVRVGDVLSGFRAFTAQAYPKLAWQSSDYSVEVEMTINAGKFNLKYAEMPVKTIYEDNYKGMDIINGFKILIKIFKFRYL